MRIIKIFTEQAKEMKKAKQNEMRIDASQNWTNTATTVKIFQQLIE